MSRPGQWTHRREETADHPGMVRQRPHSLCAWCFIKAFGLGVMTTLFMLMIWNCFAIIGYTYGNIATEVNMNPVVARGLMADAIEPSSFMDLPIEAATVIVTETQTVHPVPATNTPMEVSTGMSHAWGVPNNGTVLGSTGMVTGTRTAVSSNTAIVSPTDVAYSKMQAPGYPGKPEISNVETSTCTESAELDTSTAMGIGLSDESSTLAPVTTVTSVSITRTHTFTSTDLTTISQGLCTPVTVTVTVGTPVPTAPVAEETDPTTTITIFSTFIGEINTMSRETVFTTITGDLGEMLTESTTATSTPGTVSIDIIASNTTMTNWAPPTAIPANDTVVAEITSAGARLGIPSMAYGYAVVSLMALYLF